MKMKVRDIMTSRVNIASPMQTVRDAAQMMADTDVGVLPVGDNDRLVGMVTDRDIALRACAAGHHPDECRVSDVMTPDVKYLYDDETIEDVARNMGDLQVRRLPVLNRKKRLVGIVALADLAVKAGGRPTEAAITEVSRPI